MELLFEEEYLQIFLDTENKWMYARWVGDQTKESVLEGCQIMLDCAKENNLTKVLNDNRDVTTSWSAAAEWVGTTWFPAMAKANVKYFAWIYSPFVFSQLSVDTSISFAKDSPDIATFSDEAEAKNWLSSRG